MKSLIFGGIFASCTLLLANATELDEAQHRLNLDVMEATLRSRLEAKPPARGEVVYVYVDRGLGSGLEARLKQYRIVVRSGSVGPKPPRQRWYWMHLGQITRHNATILVEDSTKRLKDVQLVKKGPRWVIVGEHIPVLH
jgi:hypothetical protein